MYCVSGEPMRLEHVIQLMLQDRRRPHDAHRRLRASPGKRPGLLEFFTKSMRHGPILHVITCIVKSWCSGSGAASVRGTTLAGNLRPNRFCSRRLRIGVPVRSTPATRVLRRLVTAATADFKHSSAPEPHREPHQGNPPGPPGYPDTHRPEPVDVLVDAGGGGTPGRRRLVRGDQFLVGGVPPRLHHWRLRQPRPLRAHSRVHPSPRVQAQDAELRHRPDRQPAPVLPVDRAVPEVPPQASRLPGRVRAGRRRAEPVGSEADRALVCREGNLAALLSVLPGAAPDAHEGSAGAAEARDDQPRRA